MEELDPRLREPDCLFDPDCCSMGGCHRQDGLRRFMTGNEDGYRRLIRLCEQHAPNEGIVLKHLQELTGAAYRDLWAGHLEFEKHHGGARRDGYMSLDESRAGCRLLIDSWLEECASMIIPVGTAEFERVRYRVSPVFLFPRKSDFSRLRSYGDETEGKVSWMTHSKELLRTGQTTQDRKDAMYVETELMKRVMAACPGLRVETAQNFRFDRTMSAPDGALLARLIVRYEAQLRDEAERAVVLVHAL